MRSKELASRYAKAVYELAADNRHEEKVLVDLRALEQVFSKDPEVLSYLTSRFVQTDERINLLKKAMENNGLSQEAFELAVLMARNGRLGIFSEVVHAYEAEIDAANNVCRGSVRSAVSLSPAEREHIEKTVEKVLSKKVIMTYTVDPSVIGGLVAKVGSYTFDDSIATHLKRMNEELKRRTV